MKPLIYLSVLLISIMFVWCEQILKKPNNEGTPEIVFESLEHDFGKIPVGEKVSYNFKFKNTGSGTLIIRSVETSCGCTVPKYKKRPIPPGGKGNLKVILDSSEKAGPQLNTIEITSNAFKTVMVLIIKAEVI